MADNFTSPRGLTLTDVAGRHDYSSRQICDISYFSAASSPPFHTDTVRLYVSSAFHEIYTRQRSARYFHEASEYLPPHS